MLYDIRKSVWDAAEACRKIQAYTARQTLEMYLADNMRRLAIERLFGILGEAFNRIDDADPSFRDHISEMGNVIGMRNRLAHGYDRTINETVWTATQDYVPILTEKLTAWLDVNG